MHIAIATLGPLTGDGVSRVVESWARMLAASDIETTVISEKPRDGAALPPIPGARHAPYELAEDASGFGSFLELIARAGETCAELSSQGRVDLIISHHSLISRAIRRHLPSAPLLQTFHSPMVDEGRLNNWRYASTVRRISYPARAVGFWTADAMALRKISCAHTLSEYTWDLLGKRYPRLCRRVPWKPIPGSVDTARFGPAPDRALVRTSLGLDPDALILLTVRRLVPRNGVDRILRCAARAGGEGKIRFLIGGTGPLRRSLDERIAAEGLSDRVELLGFVPEETLPDYYRAADAFLLPTRELECFGLPLVEAMSCDCTPLVTPTGGPSEICRNYPEYVARANSTEAFAELVERFVSGSIPRRIEDLAPDTRRRYSEEAIRPEVVRLVEQLARQERT